MNDLLHLVLSLILVCTVLGVNPEDIQEHACLGHSDCQHGGTCEKADGFVTVLNVCACKPPYVGVVCEQECPLACENGGKCNYKEGESFFCKCPDLFTGSLCQEPATQCDQEVECLNGGKCVKNHSGKGDEYMCDCPPGYEGFTCSVETAGAIIQGGDGQHKQQPQQKGTDLVEPPETGGKKAIPFSTISIVAFVAIFVIMAARLATRGRRHRHKFNRMATNTEGAFDAEMDDMSRHNTDII